MIGTSISHYEILEQLGEGGMGVVYKARDTKLDRLVALKFLSSQVSSSGEEESRFIQEARAAAALSHPNVCTIFGVDQHEGRLFIAMEYIEGQTLREKMPNLPLKQAIEIGIQIAEGLAAAHEAGIVHRDLKPENIMLQKDGRVRIMDFGLAKLKGVSRLTKAGSTVGTAGYMSPEQVQGMETDHRTDIFSLGVILYELFARRSPFKGVHETAINYEIVNVEPEPMVSVNGDLDPDLDRIVFECLHKDPDERHQAVKETAKELRRFKRESSRQHVTRVSQIGTAAVPVSHHPPAGSQKQQTGVFHRMGAVRLPWIVLSVFFCATTIASLILLVPQGATPPPDLIQAFLPPPENTNFSHILGGGHLAISPDGRRIALAVVDSTGTPSLWVRSLNSLSGSRLSGTEGALFPFWSPDSRYIGFFADRKLKKIEATGGPTFTLCDAVNPRGGSWSQEGVIVFPPDQLSGLFLVSDRGGTPQEVTALDSAQGEMTHRWPFFLPDGKHFLFFSRGGTSGKGNANELDAICVASLDGKEKKRLITGISNAAYAAGKLLYMRERSLMAHTFSPTTFELNGDPSPISESVQFNERFSVAMFSVSQTGVLVYETRSASLGSELVLVDPHGKTILSFGEREIFVSARLSNDGRRIAMDLYDIGGRNSDIWIHEIARGVSTRFTFDPGIDNRPVWSSDGNRVVFSSNRKGHFDLYAKVTSGASNEDVLLESDQDKQPTDWSSNGEYVLFTTVSDPVTKADIWLLPMSGDRKPRPILHTNFAEMNGTFSPDMRWIAFQSNESGNNQVYVCPFPGLEAKWQVSTSDGASPRWSTNGTEIFYLSGGRVMSAEVRGEKSTFEIRKTTMLFDLQSVGPNRGRVHSISPDGKKFLVEIPRDKSTSPSLTLVVNWDARLAKR